MKYLIVLTVAILSTYFLNSCEERQQVLITTTDTLLSGGIVTPDTIVSWADTCSLCGGVHTIRCYKEHAKPVDKMPGDTSGINRFKNAGYIVFGDSLGDSSQRSFSVDWYGYPGDTVWETISDTSSVYYQFNDGASFIDSGNYYRPSRGLNFANPMFGFEVTNERDKGFCPHHDHNHEELYDLDNLKREWDSVMNQVYEFRFDIMQFTDQMINTFQNDSVTIMFVDSVAFTDFRAYHKPCAKDIDCKECKNPPTGKLIRSVKGLDFLKTDVRFRRLHYGGLEVRQIIQKYRLQENEL
jgi:hypothetical protein